MGKHTDQRDRTLCLARILYEETDEKHPMPMTEMIRRLEEEGVASERKSIYRDLAAMNKQGFEVAYRHGKTGGWYLAGRPLNLSELQTVIDAVAGLPLDSSGAAGVSAGQAGRALSPGTARPAAPPGLAAAPGGDSARGGPAGAGPRPHRPAKPAGTAFCLVCVRPGAETGFLGVHSGGQPQGAAVV